MKKRPNDAVLPAASRRAPVVVGGIGGSGTRLVALILRELGYHIGTDCNQSDDNLWFTLLFSRREVVGIAGEEFSRLARIFAQAMLGGGRVSPDDEAAVRRLAAEDREGHEAAWLRQRADSLLTQNEPRPADEPWGWKEPNSHIVLAELVRVFEGMKYVLVMRHALDMAFSANQNQARLWGPVLLGEPYDGTPRYSLRYWCAAHRRLLATAVAIGGRFHVVNYDGFCQRPPEQAAALCEFLGVDAEWHTKRLAALVRPSPTIGRSASHLLSEFDTDDIAYVESLGFNVSRR